MHSICSISTVVSDAQQHMVINILQANCDVITVMIHSSKDIPKKDTDGKKKKKSKDKTKTSKTKNASFRRSHGKPKSSAADVPAVAPEVAPEAAHPVELAPAVPGIQIGGWCLMFGIPTHPSCLQLARFKVLDLLSEWGLK